MQKRGSQTISLVKLHLQQLDYYGAWRSFIRLNVHDEVRKATLAKWLKSGYELYHFQFNHLFSTLSELYEERWITHDQFSLAWDHWDHLINQEGSQQLVLLDSLQDEVHHMELYLKVGDYLAFLTRLYRFRELLILYLYLKAGKEEWVQQYQPGRAPESIKELEGLYLSHELRSHYGAYMFLHSKQLSEVIHLRNHSLIGHGRLGVTSTSVWQTYGRKWYRSNRISTQAFLEDMTILFQDLGVELTENPYRIFVDGIIRALDVFGTEYPDLAAPLPDNAMFEVYLQQYQYQTLLNQIDHKQLPGKLMPSLNCAQSMLLGNLSVEQCQLMKNTFTKYTEETIRPSPLTLLLPLVEGRQSSFINFLYSQLQVFERRHDYGEMMIRVYRLMEELMIYFLGYDVDAQKVCLVPQSNVKPRVNIGTRSHTFSGLQKALKQAETSGPWHDFYAVVKEPWWDGVAEEHRHSIVGHGIESITLEHIEETLGLTLPQLLDKLEQVMKLLGIVIEANYFDTLNELILWKYRTLQKQ